MQLVTNMKDFIALMKREKPEISEKAIRSNGMAQCKICLSRMEPIGVLLAGDGTIKQIIEKCPTPDNYIALFDWPSMRPSGEPSPTDILLTLVQLEHEVAALIKENKG